jgi:hypothetical protein
MMRSQIVFLVILLVLQFGSYSCIRYFLHNILSHSQKSKVQALNSEYLDYNSITNLDTKVIESLDLNDEGSFILEDGAKIIISDKFSAELQKNQVLCASAKFLNELNTTGYIIFFLLL